MAMPVTPPNWLASRGRDQEFFRIIFIRFTANPHDLRAIGHQDDTGRNQAAHRRGGFVPPEEFQPFNRGGEITGAGRALSNIPGELAESSLNRFV
jgi:hypothetical protein